MAATHGRDKLLYPHTFPALWTLPPASGFIGVAGFAEAPRRSVPVVFSPSAANFFKSAMSTDWSAASPVAWRKTLPKP